MCACPALRSVHFLQSNKKSKNYRMLSEVYNFGSASKKLSIMESFIRPCCWSPDHAKIFASTQVRACTCMQRSIPGKFYFLFAGTFRPASLASEMPMAIAWFLFFTLMPELLLSFPSLNSCITLVIFFCAATEYFFVIR